MKNKKKMHRKEQTLEVGWCQDESFITIDDQFSRRVNNGGKKVLFFSLVFSVGRLLRFVSDALMHPQTQQYNNNKKKIIQ